MTGRQRYRATSRTKLAIASLILGGSALGLAGQASADPELYPTPEPGATPVPGQPVVEEPGSVPVAAPAPPPIGAPVVPEIENQVYGSGKTSGPLGFLRDAWHQAQNPYAVADTPDGMPAATPPPPGAGAAPQLPPGYTSLTAPESNGPPSTTNYSGGPALPEGYYPLNGPPPPPEYFDGPPAPAAPPGPAPYQPVHSPPPPPLMPTP